jgi:hypothetical protein
MLVPLNRPGSTPRKKPGVGVKAIVLFARTLGLVFKVCFGWLGWILNRSEEHKFAAEVRRELYFLFEDYDARLIPPKRSSGYETKVIVEFGVIRLLIGRHHGETAFAVASVFAPDHWEAFQVIVSGITTWPSSPAATTRTPIANDLASFAPIIGRSLGFLQDALSKDNVHSTLTKAIEMENASVDAYAERARANGVEPVIYTSSLKDS